MISAEPPFSAPTGPSPNAPFAFQGTEPCYRHGRPGTSGDRRRRHPRDYHLAAGPLADVLARFAANAGVPLSFDPALLQGRQSQGLQGSFSVPEGLLACWPAVATA